MRLNEPVARLKGVGEKRSQALETQGIHTIMDLLNVLPNRYEDRTILGSFSEQPKAKPETFKLTVVKQGTVRRIRPNLSLFVLPVEWIRPDGERIRGEAIWFNQPYMGQHFKVGKSYYMFGKLTKKDKQPYRIYSPKTAPVEEGESFLRIFPIYPKREGISGKIIENLMSQALDLLDENVDDPLPHSIRERFSLPEFRTMMFAIHRPKSAQELRRARERLKFEEGLRVALGIEKIRRAGFGSPAVISDPSPVEPFLKSLPFELTAAQKRVLSEILADLKENKAMNRMVQGDVGSGKTVLAAACAYLFALNGYQTAFMAPTEILAEQHYKTFQNLFKPFKYSIALLTGSVPKREAKEIRERLRTGEIDIVIGTHALLTDTTEFYNTALVITDEQHRFGVRQRGIFSQKSGAHTLVMSATPIPRTTALTVFGDLDLSVIDELPAGRQRIKTYFYTVKKINKILSFIDKEIENGNQAYIVCPFVEASDEMEGVSDVESTFKKMKKHAAGRYAIGMLHGALDADAKEKAMRDFAEGKTKLLVATSIIEVGIDVKDATCMLILSADRFGLAQLHQLRGRIGRSSKQSYCFLSSENLSEKTIERMKIIVGSTDGQKIALADYKLRGPGEYFGYAQHGYSGLRLLDPLQEPELFKNCVLTAKFLYESGGVEEMQAKDRLLSEFSSYAEQISLT